MGVVPRVVVVGAGFGGIALAKELAGSPVEVTLVDRNNFTTFQPLLYQVATSGLNAADVAYAVRGLLRRQPNVRFRQGEVTGVDWETRALLLDDHDPLPFDQLVIAAGATVNWFGVPGADEHGYPLYTLADAIQLRNHVLDRFEASYTHPELVDEGALTVVVVGGGPTGVETAGALAELFAMVFAKDYPGLPISRARIVLVELLPHLLPPFHPSSRRHALESLAERNVEVRLGDQVKSVDASSVTLASGEVIPAQTLVWAAGVRANPLADVLGLAQEQGGRIKVDSALRVPGHPGVWAIGDIAAAPDGRGGLLPQLAPVAMQSGRHVARLLRRAQPAGAPEPFRYRDKGTMATIGRRAAVAELPIGLRLRGGLAWLAWLGLHLLYLSGIRNRVSVLLNWAWSYLTWDRGPRLLIRTRDEP